MPGSWGACPKGPQLITPLYCLLTHFHLIGVNLLGVLADGMVRGQIHCGGGEGGVVFNPSLCFQAMEPGEGASYGVRSA